MCLWIGVTLLDASEQLVSIGSPLRSSQDEPFFSPSACDQDHFIHGCAPLHVISRSVLELGEDILTSHTAVCGLCTHCVLQGLGYLMQIQLFWPLV